MITLLRKGNILLDDTQLKSIYNIVDRIERNTGEIVNAIYEDQDGGRHLVLINEASLEGLGDCSRLNTFMNDMYNNLFCTGRICQIRSKHWKERVQDLKNANIKTTIGILEPIDVDYITLASIINPSFSRSIFTLSQLSAYVDNGFCTL